MHSGMGIQVLRLRGQYRRHPRMQSTEGIGLL